MTTLEMFFDAVAGAIVCEHKQKKWKLNLPVISATGESLGITPADLESGGRYFDEIGKRVAALGATVAGFDISADAKRTAELLFGPNGEWAANFMKRRWL
jgi:hypothetical protein